MRRHTSHRFAQVFAAVIPLVLAPCLQLAAATPVMATPVKTNPVKASPNKATAVKPAAVKPAAPKGIRDIDFLNFTYPTGACAEDIPAFGRQVSVRKGKFHSREVYYDLVGGKPRYGDVNGDGLEDAVIQIRCGGFAGNYSLAEVFVYGFSKGKPVLLARLDDRDFEKDYLRYYRNGFLWGMVPNGISLSKGQLSLKRYAEGPHAGPTYVVTLNYRFQGNALALSGKPARVKAVW